MLAQQIDFDRVLIVRFGRLEAAYGYDRASDTWQPCEDLPPGFPPRVEFDALTAWEPVWSE